MRRSILLLTMVGALVLVCSAVALAQRAETGSSQPSPAEERFAPGEVLVKFEPGASGQDIAEAHRQNGGQVKETIRGIDVQVVGVARGQEKADVERYQRNPNVEYAEVNGLYEAVGSVPNDPKVGNQWAFNNTGQTIGTTVGTPDADIDAYEAWNGGSATDWKAGTTGSAAFPIAILDTGVKEDHVDLQGKVTKRVNFTSSSTNGDVKGHGTHVAGSVGALTDNGIGVSGTCPGCVLYNVKVLGDAGTGYLDWIANGITWSSDNGAKVINISLGSTSGKTTLQKAVDYAWSKGVVVAAAAGNNGSDSPFYPAAYPNVIAVGATDHKDNKVGYSNYGSWVDVAAPGSAILSTTKDGGYASKGGTSMATPHVAGAAGLVFGTGLCGSNNACVRNKIESSAEDRMVLRGVGPDWSKARINACAAVGGTSCDPPDTTAPTVSGVSPENGATEVARTANATATFSEEMDPSTLTTSTFTLVKDGTTTPVAATVSYDAATKKAVLDPSADLEAGTKYMATVEGGAADCTACAKDKSGNPLATDKVWYFTTTSPDTTAPSIIGVSPSNGKTGVARGTNVAAIFSEAIDPATLTSSTFTLVKDGTTTAISATRTLSSDGKTATLNPYGSTNTNLARCTRYKAAVTTGLKDKVGNPLAANKVWYFKTKC